MTRKESRREAKRRSVVADIQSRIDYMKKKSEERKVSAKRIAEKEQNMFEFYHKLFGPRFSEYVSFGS